MRSAGTFSSYAMDKFTLIRAIKSGMKSRFKAMPAINFMKGKSMALQRKRELEAFKLLFSVPGSAILYYGDEIGMENEVLAPEQKDTRKSLRGKFNWELAGQYALDEDSLLAKLTNIIHNRNRKKL